MKNLQKGFIVPVVLVVIALLVIGGGVYVYESKKTETPATLDTGKRQQTNTQTPAVSAQQNVSASVNFKLFNSSSLPNQFDFFEFKYPDSWELYARDGGRVYLAKEKGLSADTVTRQQEKYIEVNMSNDTYSQESIKRNFNPISIGVKRINGEEVIWFTLKGFEDKTDNIIAYSISSKYVNKKNITFSLNSQSSQPSPEDIKVLEGIVGSFKVIETEKGTSQRNSQYVVPPLPQ